MPGLGMGSGPAEFGCEDFAAIERDAVDPR
jgi:hypothetical protein